MTDETRKLTYLRNLKKLSAPQKQDLRLWLQYKNYEKNPRLWLKDRLPKLYDSFGPYQFTIFESAADTGDPIKQVAIVAGRGAGKTTAVATAVVFWIDVYETLGIEWFVQTTAPIMSILKTALWKEIRNLIRQLEPGGPEHDPNIASMRGRFGEATARTAPIGKTVNIESAHAPRMLVVIDEAKGVHPDIYESLKGTYSEAGNSGNRAVVMVTSTAGLMAGEFWNIFSNQGGRYDGWNRIRISSEEAIAAGRVSKVMFDLAEAELGRQSVRFRTDYLAEFVPVNLDGFVTQEALDGSNARWNQMMVDKQVDSSNPIVVGVDVAGQGADKSAIAVYDPKDNIILEVWSEPKTNNLNTLVAKVLEYKAATIVIDAIGIGAGPVDTLKQHLSNSQRLISYKANAATSYVGVHGYVAKNVRTASFDKLAQLIDPTVGAPLALPPDDTLRAEISAHRFMADGLGDKIALEPKSSVKEILGCSPDLADAVAMAVWGANRAVSLPPVSFPVSAGPNPGFG